MKQDPGLVFTSEELNTQGLSAPGEGRKEERRREEEGIQPPSEIANGSMEIRFWAACFRKVSKKQLSLSSAVLENTGTNCPCHGEAHNTVA